MRQLMILTKRVTEYIKNNNIDKIKYFRNRENIGPDAKF